MGLQPVIVYTVTQRNVQCLQCSGVEETGDTTDGGFVINLSKSYPCDFAANKFAAWYSLAAN